MSSCFSGIVKFEKDFIINVCMSMQKFKSNNQVSPQFSLSSYCKCLRAETIFVACLGISSITLISLSKYGDYACITKSRLDLMYVL